MTEGPYQFSRHPIYVAAAAMTLAYSLALNSTWPAALLLPWLAYCHLHVIPREEVSVHAWLGVRVHARAYRHLHVIPRKEVRM